MLHVDADVLADRIKADEVEQGARRWRLSHLQMYAAARPWMVEAADLVIDSSRLPVADVAASIRDTATAR